MNISRDHKILALGMGIGMVFGAGLGMVISKPESNDIDEIANTVAETIDRGMKKIETERQAAVIETNKNAYKEAIVQAVEDRTEEEMIVVTKNPEIEFEPSEDGTPYVISLDTFEEEDVEYDKYELSYYDVDDILSDDQDKVVIKTDEIVGYKNLSRFGEGSQDPHMVYVRNDKTKADYAITLERASYSETVLGVDASAHKRRGNA